MIINNEQSKELPSNLTNWLNKRKITQYIDIDVSFFLSKLNTDMSKENAAILDALCSS